MGGGRKDLRRLEVSDPLELELQVLVSLLTWGLRGQGYNDMIYRPGVLWVSNLCS